jgi:hypothetical protein
MNTQTDKYLMKLDLEETEARANITLSDYCEAYKLQYGPEREWKPEQPDWGSEPYWSFCCSAVIDATEVWPEDEALVAALYHHLDPDGRDANITVAQAGKIALELRNSE